MNLSFKTKKPRSTLNVLKESAEKLFKDSRIYLEKSEYLKFRSYDSKADVLKFVKIKLEEKISKEAF